MKTGEAILEALESAGFTDAEVHKGHTESTITYDSIKDDFKREAHVYYMVKLPAEDVEE